MSGVTYQFAQNGIVVATLHYPDDYAHTYDALMEAQEIHEFLDYAYDGDIPKALVGYVAERGGSIDPRDLYFAAGNYPDLSISQHNFPVGSAPVLVLQHSTRQDGYQDPTMLIAMGADDHKTFIQEAFEEAFMCQDGSDVKFGFGLIVTEEQLAEVLSEIEMNGDEVWYVFDDGQERFLK